MLPDLPPIVCPATAAEPGTLEDRLAALEPLGGDPRAAACRGLAAELTADPAAAEQAWRRAPHPRRRLAFRDALRAAGPDAIPILLRILGSRTPDPAAALDADGILARLFAELGRPARDAAWGWIESPRDPGQRTPIALGRALALSLRDDPAPLLALMERGAPPARRAAARLAFDHGVAFEPMALLALKDADPDVRRAALDAVSARRPLPPAVEQAARALFHDPDRGIAELARRQLTGVAPDAAGLAAALAGSEDPSRSANQRGWDLVFYGRHSADHADVMARALAARSGPFAWCVPPMLERPALADPRARDLLFASTPQAADRYNATNRVQEWLQRSAPEHRTAFIEWFLAAPPATRSACLAALPESAVPDPRVIASLIETLDALPASQGLLPLIGALGAASKHDPRACDAILRAWRRLPADSVYRRGPFVEALGAVRGATPELADFLLAKLDPRDECCAHAAIAARTFEPPPPGLEHALLKLAERPTPAATDPRDAQRAARDGAGARARARLALVRVTSNPRDLARRLVAAAFGEAGPVADPLAAPDPSGERDLTIWALHQLAARHEPVRLLLSELGRERPGLLAALAYRAERPARGESPILTPDAWRRATAPDEIAAAKLTDDQGRRLLAAAADAGVFGDAWRAPRLAAARVFESWALEDLARERPLPEETRRLIADALSHELPRFRLDAVRAVAVLRQDGAPFQADLLRTADEESAAEVIGALDAIGAASPEAARFAAAFLERAAGTPGPAADAARRLVERAARR